ncbi:MULTISPECIES: hypothetical protein [Proteiniphilum]|nr:MULTISPECIES: hypothetical protein [Proteiniphilum]MDY9919377.1 hypothetical protein [Proteiniphilum sp.]
MRSDRLIPSGTRINAGKTITMPTGAARMFNAVPYGTHRTRVLRRR